MTKHILLFLDEKRSHSQYVVVSAHNEIRGVLNASDQTHSSMLCYQVHKVKR